MDENDRKSAALAFLAHARPVAGSNRFAVGTYERNITLFRQQMRALNLVYAMRTASDDGLPENRIGRVAVIGGGAFGVTAAAAAASVGMEVHLYEQHQILLPLQRGCDTRWVNPLYYEWPAPGSESRFAALPLANWRSGTASQVADQLVAGLEEVAAATDRLTTLTGVRDLRVVDETPASGGRQAFLLTCRYAGDHQDVWRCDAVVYATGFGVEHDLGGSTPSYWRNDNLGQVELRTGRRGQQRHLVSGVGDGGLTDVARLKITDFHHERLFFELFGDASDALRRELQALTDAFAAGPKADDWLFAELMRIETREPDRGPLAPARQRLRERLRDDTRVWLNGRTAQFIDALSLRNVSLSNALLAFLLYRLGAFEYVSGTLSRNGQKWSLSGQPAEWKVPASVVVRHGTDRHSPLEAAGFPEAVEELRSRADAAQSARRLFPAGWWARNRRPRDAATVDAVARPTEFAPPTTVTVATTFVTTLSDVLVELLRHRDRTADGRPGGPLIRMTLHRVARIGEEEVFQQVSPYRGLLIERQRGGTGRIFPVGPGMVGLALRTGRPIVFRRQTDELGEMEGATAFGKLLAQPIEPHVDSMIACPFFAADPAGTGEARVNFVLFADTSDRSFFEDDRLRLLYAACKGFVHNIEESLAERRLRQVTSAYPGYRAESPLDSAEAARFEAVGISFDNEVFAEFRTDLTFSSLVSTELDDDVLGLR